MDEPSSAERLTRIEERLSGIEARLSELERGRTARPDPVAWAAASAAAEPRTPSSGASGASPAPAWVLPAAGKSRSAPEWAGLASDAVASWSKAIADLEERLTGRALAVVGGTALVVGAIFFLSLAFSRGWIGPEGRVLIGIAAATLALVLGAWLLEHRQPVVGQVVVAVGLAVASLAVFAAARLYGLIPVEVALLVTLAASIIAAGIAVRHDSGVVAAFALLAVLAAPPVLGASASPVTIAYIGTVLVGSTLLALLRTWRYLPGLAFVLSAPQVASWEIGETCAVLGLAGVLAFWSLNVAAAGGEEYLRPTNRLRTAAATLVVANAAFAIWAGFVVLDGRFEPLRGTFLVILAVAHLVVGGWFLRRDGDRHPFGLLAVGTGAAAMAMAAPVQFGGPAVPVAWAAEAAALAWVASLRAHPYALRAGAALAGLAVIHVLAFEYPIETTSLAGIGTASPFLNGNALTVAFIVGAASVASYVLRGRFVVAVLAGLSVLIVANALAHELTGLPLLTAWTMLALGALALDRFVLTRIERVELPWAVVPPSAREATLAAAAVVAALVIGRALSVDLPVAMFGQVVPPEIPFGDLRAVAILVVASGLLVAGPLYERRLGLGVPTVISIVGAMFAVAYGATFEVYADAAIVLGAALAAIAFALSAAPTIHLRAVLIANRAAFALVALGTLAGLAIVAPPSRLFVSADTIAVHPPFISGATFAFGALAAALIVGAARSRRPLATVSAVGSGILVLYLLSVGVVDLFQARVGGPTPVTEVATQAQVALSVLWIVVGAAVFVFGLAHRRLIPRQAGLALLAIASAKVFLFDLAALDVAYRVLSLVALGTLLLLTAYVYTRLAPPPRVESGRPSEDPEPTPNRA